MEFLEKNLEDIIWESDKSKLLLRGFDIDKGVLKRQLKIGNYGILDLIQVRKEYYYCIDRYKPFLIFNIIELKKDKIGISAFFQAVNYVQGIKTYIEKKHPDVEYDFEITLIGKDVDTSGSFVYLPDLINSFNEVPLGSLSRLKLFTYKYGVEGIDFKSHKNYNLMDKGF